MALSPFKGDADAEGASVNLQFSSFAPRHRLSELISALGLSSVATEGGLSPPEERAFSTITLSSPRSLLALAKCRGGGMTLNKIKRRR